MLLGDDGDGPKDLGDAAAEALEHCREELLQVAGLLGGLGESLERVTIPTFETSRTEVMGFSVISGIDIDERPLLADAVEHVGDGADRLTGVADDLGGVADRLRRLGVQLADTGGDLGEVGGRLADSGTTLRSFVDAGTPATRKPATRKPATRKPAKKATTKKKTPAKKPSSKKKTPATKTSRTKKTAAKKASNRSTIRPPKRDD